MQPTPTTDAPVTDPDYRRQAADVDRLLRDQLFRLRNRFLLHGLGAVLAIPAAAVLLFFLLDRTLRLPVAIRLFHTLVVIALVVGCLWWFVRRPLRAALHDLDVAVLLERVFPQLGQRLISAVQLKQLLAGGALRNQSPAMIERLVADAAAESSALPLEQVFDPRRTRRIWGAAAAAALVLATGALLAPDTAWTFLRRHLGLEVPYPKLTNLVVELPPAGSDIQRRDYPGGVELTLAGGADLHVSVLAEGRVPDEVFLDVTGQAGERSIGMTPRPGGRFRHVFRRVQGSFSFHARGGDDDTGDKLVEVRTVLPPQVAEIAARLQPPAYTRRPAAEQRGGAIEGLIGTEVELEVTATAPVRSAELVFLESGRRITLEPRVVQDDSGKAQVLRTAFRLEASDRYQVELLGDSGLRSPNPGTYPIAALQDYAPVGRWLQPDEEYGLMLLPEAVLALRLDVQDDYGLVTLDLNLENVGGSRRIALLPPPPADAPPPQRAMPVALFEVRELLGERRSAAEGLALTVEARDNRAPEANLTTLPKRMVQIVDRSQLAGAIARQFRATRELVEQTADVQRDRRERLVDLADRLAAAGAVDVLQTLTGIEVGQGRVQNAAERVHRQLMSAFDVHLWNRLEPAAPAGAVLELYRDWHRAQSEPVPHAAGFYRDVASRRQAGTLGAMETTLDPILAMIALADGLHTEQAPQAMRLLAQAQVARDGRDLAQTVARLLQAQERIQAVLQDLLGRLDEWNDYQDLIQETRALRDRQREVQSRTDDLRGGNERGK